MVSKSKGGAKYGEYGRSNTFVWISMQAMEKSTLNIFDFPLKILF